MSYTRKIFRRTDTQIFIGDFFGIEYFHYIYKFYYIDVLANKVKTLYTERHTSTMENLRSNQHIVYRCHLITLIDTQSKNNFKPIIILIKVFKTLQCSYNVVGQFKKSKNHTLIAIC